MTLLFVYGTLMLGESNHGLIAPYVTRVSTAWVEGMKLMQPYPDYPCMVRGAGRVQGEILSLDPLTAAEALRVMDQLEDYYGEGHPENEYNRVRILVHPLGLEAWAFLWARPLIGLSAIPSGDWRQRRSN